MIRPRHFLGLLATILFGYLITTASCTSPITRPTVGKTNRAFAIPVPEAPITNYARITPEISRGAYPDVKGLQYLKDSGFRTVINLRTHHSEKAEAEKIGLGFIDLPLRADLFGSDAPDEEEVRKFFSIVLDPARRPVYFHCAHGKDRTGTMAALYRIEVDGWTNDEAIEEMMAFGYHTNYQDLVNYVKHYKPLGLVKRD